MLSLNETHVVTDAQIVKSLLGTVAATMDCVHPVGEHGGAVAGWIQSHTCMEGWLCADHVSYMLLEALPRIADHILVSGLVRCSLCHKSFATIDSFVKVLT